MLAGIEAALADFGAIGAADDIRDSFPALATLLSRAQQLASFQDDLIERGDCILRCLVERLTIVTRFSFVHQIRDFLNELEQLRLRLGGFDHRLNRGLIAFIKLASIAPLDLVTR